MTKRNNSTSDNQRFSTFEELFFSHYVYEFEHLGGSFIVTDLNLIVRFVGSKAGLILGLRPSSAIGKSLKKVFPDSLLLDAIENGVEPDNLKTRSTRKKLKGRDLSFGIQSLRFQGKAFALVENIVDDSYVNSLESRNAKLSIENRLLKMLLNQSFEEFYAVDRKGRLTYVTKKSAGNRGYETSEILGLDVTKFDPDCQLKEIVETGVTKIRQHSRPKKGEISVIEAPLINNDYVIGAFLRSPLLALNEEEHDDKPAKIQHKKQRGALLNRMISGCKFTLSDIIGRSDAIENTKKKALRIAESDSTVLITGESGTGKEIFAHAIHVASVRKNRPFIRVNCASIPETLLEAERL